MKKLEPYTPNRKRFVDSRTMGLDGTGVTLEKGRHNLGTACTTPLSTPNR